MNDNFKRHSVEVRTAQLPSGLGIVAAISVAAVVLAIISKQLWLGGLGSIGLGVVVLGSSLATFIRGKTWMQWHHDIQGYKTADYDREKTPLQFFLIVLGMTICSVGLVVLGVYLLLKENV